jgi:hypothetical protein
MKQTAVEWLLGILEQNDIIVLDSVDSDKYYNIIEQAKEMENERLKEAYSMGRMGKSIKEFNETFKSDDNNN